MSAAACVARDVEVTTTGSSRTRLSHGVSLTVPAGQLMGVVGESGAGKTMTVRALLGVLPSGVRASGALEIDGAVTALDDAAGLRRLLGSTTSIVLQNPHSMLDPLMRVGAQLVEGVVRQRLLSTAEAAARARTLLAQMGFDDVDRIVRLYPHQLSGGMAQRVTVAIGMMPAPRLLVVDEPTSALDANVRLEVLRSLRSLAESERTAVILVSHDLGLVSHFCDLVTTMYAGAVVEQGRTREVVQRPTHPYTAALLAASATLTTPRKQFLPVIPGAAPRPSALPRGCSFSPRCARASARCGREVPLLLDHGDGRVAACHHPLLEEL